MDKKDKGLLGLLVLLVGLLAAMAVVVFQMRSRLAVVSQLRLEVERDREAQEKYENLLNEFSREKAEEIEWRSLLVTDEEGVAQFAATVEALARDLGLSLTIKFDDLQTRVELAGKQGVGLKVELALSGNYEAMKAFLRGLETGKYLVKQNRLQLSQQGSGSYTLTMTGVLIMKQK